MSKLSEAGRRRAGRRDSIWRSALAVLTALAAVAVVGVASTPDEPERAAFVQFLGWQVAAELDPLPTTEMVPRATDTSRARHGTEGGYRRAVVFVERGRDCDVELRPVECGAKLELFRRARHAADRAATLQAEGRSARQLGAAVVRFAPDLDPGRKDAYLRALRDAMAETAGFSDLPRVT